MIRETRRRFVIFTMCVLTGVLLVPMVALNVLPSVMAYNQDKVLLKQVVQSEIRVRTPMKAPDMPKGKRYDESLPEIGFTTPLTTTTTLSATIDTTTSVSVTTAAFSTQNTTAAAFVTRAATESTTTTHVATESPTTVRATQETTTSATPPLVQTRPTMLTTQPFQPPETYTRPVQTQPPFQQEIQPPHHWEETRPDWHDWQDNRDWNHKDWEFHGENAFGGIVAVAETYPLPNRELPPEELPPDAFPPDAPPPDKGRENQGSLPVADTASPQKPDEEEKDYFLLFVDLDGTLNRETNVEEYDVDTLQTMADAIRSSGKSDGYYLEQLQYYAQSYEKGMIIGCKDRAVNQNFLHKLMIVSIIVFLLMEMMVLVLTIILTKKAMLPMQISMEQQKQFISDAGHELKTPLTIISANADILQDEVGENKWLTYIQMQAERMRVLIDEMLTLTKMEHKSVPENMTAFNLSNVIETTALPFESQAFEMQKKLEIAIQPDIFFTGNQEQIRRLVGVFIDNAFKYSDDHGEIRVTLAAENDRGILQVYNTGKGIRKDEKEKIFERFYRSDSSRARTTGGYGLGLSIAKNIADAHKIKIEVACEEEKWITFTLFFPAS